VPTLRNCLVGLNGINSKVEAATSLLQQLQNYDPDFVGELIENYEKMFDAYLHLISMSPEKFGKKMTKIPLSEACKKASDHLDRCLGTGSRKVVEGVYQRFEVSLPAAAAWQSDAASSEILSRVIVVRFSQFKMCRFSLLLQFQKLQYLGGCLVEACRERERNGA